MTLHVELGKEEWVARCHDALHREEASVAVVGVQSPALPWVVAEDDIGPGYANDTCDLPAPLQLRGEFAVYSAEKEHLSGSAETFGSFALFILSDIDQRHRVCVFVPGSLRPVSADQVVHHRSSSSPLRQGRAALELDVIGVRCDREHPFGSWEVRGVIHR